MQQFVQYYPKQRTIEPIMPADMNDAAMHAFLDKRDNIRAMNEMIDAELKSGFITCEARVTKPLRHGKQTHNNERTLVRLPVTEQLAVFVNTPVSLDKLMYTEFILDA